MEKAIKDFCKKHNITPLLNKYELTDNNDAIAMALIVICVAICIAAWMFYYWFWLNKEQYRSICETCDFKGRDGICKYCGIHEHEKSLIK